MTSTPTQAPNSAAQDQGQAQSAAGIRPAANGPADHLAKLIALERQARRSESSQELMFTMVNWTHRLIPYYQAVYCRINAVGVPVVQAVSAVSAVDRNTPFTLWVKDFCQSLMKAHPGRELALAEMQDLDPVTAQAWPQWMPPNALYCPLVDRAGQVLGVLIIAREQPFHKQEVALLEVLADTYAHALLAFGESRRQGLLSLDKKKKRMAIAGSLLFLFLLLFLVRIAENVLAPAEVVPLDPIIVTSPVKGMIRDIDVKPYQMVKKDQLLFHLDDTELMNQLALAEKNLQVIQADYLRAEQKAFTDLQSKADLEVYRVQIEEKELVVRYTREELERQKVTAQQDGMVLFNDRNDWIGRPVAIGEKVMTLADPTKAEVEILMPVDDAIALEPGAEVKFFLRTDPLNPVAAKISRTSFKAEELKSGGMVFPLRAEFADQATQPRIGLQGTAKVFGGSVSLFYYLFRKPLAVIRRELGL